MLGPPDKHPSLELVFEQARDPVFIADPRADRILDANPAACRLLGYTRDELQLTPMSHIHPNELPRLREFANVALLDGINWTVELACRTKSGTYLPTEIELLALDDGNDVVVICLLRDRSEHRG